MTASAKCPHLEFSATVNVARIEDTGLKYAEVSIRCVHCGKPARFRGLPWGLSPDHPTAAVGDEEAVIPFLCEGDVYTPPATGPVGYSIQRLPGEPS